MIAIITGNEPLTCGVMPWAWEDLNFRPLPYQVTPDGFPVPGTSSEQAIRWHSLAEASLN
jgi:hypothetical protein